MKYKEFVSNVTLDFLNCRDKKAVFIKHYHSTYVTKEDVLAELTEEQEQVILFYEYCMNQFHAAYEPFISWIDELYQCYYKDLFTLEEFLEKCGIYSMHIEIFVSLLQTGITNRKEELILSEEAYEQEQILKSIYEILQYISGEHPLILILSKLHMAPCGTLQFLEYALKQEEGKLHFLLFFNDAFPVATYLIPVWNQLLASAQKQNLMVEWGQMDEIRSREQKDEIRFDITRMDYYLKEIFNMLHLFAFEDARYYLNLLGQYMESEQKRVTQKNWLYYYQISARVDILTQKFNQAQMSLEKMCFYYEPESDLITDYQYHYLMAKTHLMQMQPEGLRRHCEACRKLANALEDERKSYAADVLECMYQYGGWREIFHCNYSYRVPENLVKTAEKMGDKNLLAYLYIFGYDNDDTSMKAIAEGIKQPEYFKKGMKLASEIGNRNLLQLGYMKNIVSYSQAGYHAYVKKMYEGRLRVVDPNNIERKAHTYMGMGYTCIILEDYTSADRYFKKALEILLDLELADDVIEVLYNMAVYYFAAEKYHQAAYTVRLILNAMDHMKIKMLRICNLTKLYGILGISDYYLHNYYKCYSGLSHMETWMDHILQGDSEYVYWTEDLILYHILKGVMYEHEGDYPAADAEFEAAVPVLAIEKGVRFYIYPLYCLERASLYAKMGKPEKHRQILEEGIRYCKQEHMIIRQDMLERELLEQELFGTQTTSVPADSEVEPLASEKKILLIAGHQGTRNQLKARQKDIDFMTLCQEVLDETSLTKEEMIEKTVGIIENSYSLDDVVIISKREEMLFCDHSHSIIQLTDNQMQEIFRFFQKYQRPFITSRIETDYAQYETVTKPFMGSRIVTITGVPKIESGELVSVMLAMNYIHQNFAGQRFYLDEDNLVILKYAFFQLIEATRKTEYLNTIREMNEQLAETAIRDQLTGLYNRHAFQKIAETKMEEQTEGKNAVMYIDLDNFKYYNDTFGHPVGDMVLVQFADIIKKLTRKTGYAIRYGGDEFVVVLSGHTQDYARKIAEQIYDEIQDGFADRISLLTGKEVHIENQKKISCSIGIAEYSGASLKNLNQALYEADQALYFVKKGTKGAVVTWSDLVERDDSPNTSRK